MSDEYSENVTIGTKRRGSTELELPPDAPSDANSKAKATNNNAKYLMDDSKLPDPSLQPPSRRRGGHKRRKTDGQLQYNPSNPLFKPSSNAAFIKAMQSGLPPSAQADMQRKANDLNLQRQLKHTQIKLSEKEEQCNTAVEIIGNLQKENEDLLSVNDSIRTELGAANTEIKILEQKVTSLKEMYANDAEKYKEEIASTKRELANMEQDMNQKDMEVKQYQKSMQAQRSDDNNQNDDDQNDEKNVSKKASKQVTKLTKELKAERKKVREKDEEINQLLMQLEGHKSLQNDKEDLEKELDSLQVMAQQDLEMMKLQMEKMSNEILYLSSRNSALDQEKEDLMALLEEREYEAQMLKTGFAAHRSNTKRSESRADMNSVGDQFVDNEEYNETFEDMEFMDAKSNPIELDDVEQSFESDKQRLSVSDEVSNIKPEQPKKKVADITREYLHLTANVINIKFPRIQTISSEELINKVKNYQFWEYHDMMVRIMKTEEQKIAAKQKAEKEAKLANGHQQSSAQGGGIINKFRNFFGGNNAQKRASNVRYRNGRIGSTTDKAAPTLDDAKKKAKEIVKKGKDLKDKAVKEITGNPTEEESAMMADMEFKSVATFGDDNKKPKKPSQGL